MRVYTLTTIGDIIDETFGPTEYAIDKALHHLDADEVKAKASAIVWGGDSAPIGGCDGVNMSWVAGCR